MIASAALLTRVVQRTLTWLGVGALCGAFVLTAYAAMFQRDLSARFDREIAAASAARVESGTGPLQDGDIVGRLRIPRIGISVMVLQGTEPATLRVGAGHVPGTPTAGTDGNVAIAAHRDTFFRPLKGIRTGDRIHLETTEGTFVYRVESTEIVSPDDTRVLESRARSELTLITCYPFYFVGAAPKRFIVHATAEK